MRVDAILDSIFDEINSAYKSTMGDKYSLELKAFDSEDDMDSYVKDKDYRNKAMCFAFGWNKFKPEENVFEFEMRFNFGILYQTR